MPKILVEANNVFNTRNVTTLNTKATVNALGIITAPPTLAPTSTVLGRKADPARHPLGLVRLLVPAHPVFHYRTRSLESACKSRRLRKEQTESR